MAGKVIRAFCDITNVLGLLFFGKVTLSDLKNDTIAALKNITKVVINYTVVTNNYRVITNTWQSLMYNINLSICLQQ